MPALRPLAPVALLLLSLTLGCGGDPAATGHSTSTGTGGAGTGGAGTGGASTGGAGGAPAASPGCGKAPPHAAGGVQVTLDAGPAGDGMRSFFLSRPAQYDPAVPHKLIVGYPGTSWVGKQIQPYLDLEADAHDDEIFVYLDPLWRDFTGWGNLGGWLLGPYAAPANGDQDLVFTGAVLDYLADQYCLDPTRVFATGHSWGGDMAQVVSCFLGERFRAAVPVAANRPYWFESAPGQFITCPGTTAVWTMFGSGDDHFTWQDHPGQFGDECRDFWLHARGCAGVDQVTDLGIGAPGECVAYQGCSSDVRYCLYGPATAHQRPDYYPAETMKYFRSF
jgi:polyhydroxybutyrate depolymerase